TLSPSTTLFRSLPQERYRAGAERRVVAPGPPASGTGGPTPSAGPAGHPRDDSERVERRLGPVPRSRRYRADPFSRVGPIRAAGRPRRWPTGWRTRRP